MKSRQRHSGGSYRRMKTMIEYHAKQGKDRKKARKKHGEINIQKQEWTF